ncbi:MAG: histone deacetylase family protein, partial [Smithellaceae bacterium]|nr:histone deacetylase family protein [Smithellaceae bacterium]
GAIQAAEIGLSEPCFALIRPPGHHASAGSAWGFCYFNNMAVALEKLYRQDRIKKALILDIDLHFGDGTVNILGTKSYVTIHNPPQSDRISYLEGIKRQLAAGPFDIIGISAGFDHHVEDWGGLLTTSDYREIARMAMNAARESNGGIFAILEGGYNHRVLGKNVKAFLRGMEED